MQGENQTITQILFEILHSEESCDLIGQDYFGQELKSSKTNNKIIFHSPLFSTKSKKNLCQKIKINPLLGHFWTLLPEQGQMKTLLKIRLFHYLKITDSLASRKKPQKNVIIMSGFWEKLVTGCESRDPKNNLVSTCIQIFFQICQDYKEFVESRAHFFKKVIPLFIY